jgi:hypothetical protein
MKGVAVADMFTAIEQGVAQRLADRAIAVQEIDVGVVNPLGIAAPSVHCRITNCVFSDVAMRRQKAAVTVSLLVYLKNVRSDKARREGINPILLGIVGALMMQPLELSIAALKPVRLFEVDDEAMRTAGIMLYQLDFKTSFVCDMTEDEAGDLIAIATDFYLGAASTPTVSDMLEQQEDA